MIGHLLRDLELLAVGQILSYAGRSERMATSFFRPRRLDAGDDDAATDHGVIVLPCERPISELACPTIR